jgi:hypothetical protein
MTRDEIRAHIGKRATLKLTAQAPGGPTLTGRIEGVLDAVDGLLVTVIPDGSPSTAKTVHYHYTLRPSRPPRDGSLPATAGRRTLPFLTVAWGPA